MTNLHILVFVPDARRVTVQTLITWARDAVKNGETVTKNTPNTLAEAVSILEDSGIATFDAEIDHILNLTIAYEVQP